MTTKQNTYMNQMTVMNLHQVISMAIIERKIEWTKMLSNIRQILEINPEVNPNTFALFTFTCFGKPNYVNAFMCN